MTTPGNWKRVCLAAFVVAALSGVVCYVARQREPVYHGKSVSAWLRQFQQVKSDPERVVPRLEISQSEELTAIRLMGTNALPTLLRLVQDRDSSLRRKVLDLLVKLRVVEWRPESATVHHTMALDGFTALGPIAKPAVPALITSLNDSDAEVRRWAASCLGVVGPAAEAAVPALVQHLADPAVSEASEWALGGIHKRPDLAVPALVERLRGPGRKSSTLFALARFGPDAKTAVPAILPLLNASDEGTPMARSALKRIDPEAAARAGVK